jgi:hypothetical protein
MSVIVQASDIGKPLACPCRNLAPRRPLVPSPSQSTFSCGSFGLFYLLKIAPIADPFRQPTARTTIGGVLLEPSSPVSLWKVSAVAIVPPVNLSPLIYPTLPDGRCDGIIKSGIKLCAVRPFLCCQAGLNFRFLVRLEVPAVSMN